MISWSNHRVAKKRQLTLHQESGFRSDLSVGAKMAKEVGGGEMLVRAFASAVEWSDRNRGQCTGQADAPTSPFLLLPTFVFTSGSPFLSLFFFSLNSLALRAAFFVCRINIPAELDFMQIQIQIERVRIFFIF